MRVLIVEDDQRLVRMLRHMLEDEGYAVDSAGDGERGEALALSNKYGAIILDVMLPRKDGVALCADLRRERVFTPILMLTARDAIEDRVRGLDAGADDYLVKPFAAAELAARLRSITRRRADDVAEARLRAGGLVMDLAAHEVVRDDTPIDLSPREYALLQYLMRHPGRVLSRSQILDAVWGGDEGYSSNVVDIYVHYLRDKIDRGFEPKLLHTVRGAGYMLRV